MTTPHLPDEFTLTVDACQYHAPHFTAQELEALADFAAAAGPGCLQHTDLDDMLIGDAATVTAALRGRAGQIATWHAALIRLLADPRLAYDRQQQFQPVSRPSDGDYSPAAASFLRMAAAAYHRQRQHFEHTVTRWTLEPAGYPEDTGGISLGLRELTWD